jgi:hypothetical protein
MEDSLPSPVVVGGKKLGSFCVITEPLFNSIPKLSNVNL